MAILKNLEIWFVKCDPKRPSKTVSPENPTWEVQIRTKDKTVRAELTKLNIKTKVVRADKEDEESPILYYSANIKKKSLKKDGSASPPVQVVNGKGNDVDPNTIGNGSIANLRIVQNPFSFVAKEGGTISGIATTLMAIQLVKHIVYTPKPMEDFGDVETEVLTPKTEPAEAGGPDANDPEEGMY